METFFCTRLADRSYELPGSPHRTLPPAGNRSAQTPSRQTLSPVTCRQVSRVQPAVVMPLDADEEEVTFSSVADTAPPQPYLQYGPDDSGAGGDKGGGTGSGDAGGGGQCHPRTKAPPAYVRPTASV